MQKQYRILSKKVDILISTPGRLWNHINSGECSSIRDRISGISFLVIDEVDRMTEGSGHFKELWSILEIIHPSSSMVFSATFDTMKHSSIFKKIPFASKSPSCITTSDQTKNNLGGLAPSVSTYKLRCCATDKDASLVALLEMSPSVPTIIFVNSVSMIRRICPMLHLLGIKALPLHSQMSQRQRLSNIESIRTLTKGCNVLIATDAVGRGIDIPLITRVIHFQVPPTLEQFIHRSGRTGRADILGVAYLLLSPEEHHAFVQLSKSANNVIKEDSSLESILWEPSRMGKIKERLDIVKYVDIAEHGMKKKRSIDKLSSNLEDNDDKGHRKKISNSKLSHEGFDEESIVQKQMAASRLSKMKALLHKLNTTGNPKLSLQQ